MRRFVVVVVALSSLLVPDLGAREHHRPTASPAPGGSASVVSEHVPTGPRAFVPLRAIRTTLRPRVNELIDAHGWRPA